MQHLTDALPRCDNDRLCISGIIFQALDERASVLERDQFYLMPQRFHLAHSTNARWAMP